MQVSHLRSELLQIARHFFRQRILGPHDHDEPVARLFHHSRLGEHLEEPPEEPLVLREDV